MKIMWIGHGGLLFVSGKNKILIDPYLSNSLSLRDKTFRRKMSIKHKILGIKPDAIIITSSHPDRADLKTVKALLKKKRKIKTDVLSCGSIFKTIIKSGGYKSANHVMLAPGCEWTVGDMIVKAVPAMTDDPTAFGVIITDNNDGKKYYVASNTLYSEELLDQLPDDLFASFVPIGGAFGSMNVHDAVRFSKRLNAEFTVPVLFGMFDKNQKADDFIVGGRVVPKIYKVIQFTLFPVQSIFANSGLDMFYNEKKTKDKIDIYEDDIEAITTETTIYSDSEAYYQHTGYTGTYDVSALTSSGLGTADATPSVSEDIKDDAPLVSEDIKDDTASVGASTDGDNQ